MVLVYPPYRNTHVLVSISIKLEIIVHFFN